jgi:tetratricopeptide (TPR) repeat protein
MHPIRFQCTMTRTAATIVCMLALTVSDTPSVHAAAIELRVAGRPGTRAGDPPASVRVLALADARRRALEMFVARLGERADIKALKLAPGHLEAFILVLMEVVEPAPDAPQNGRIDIAARVDEESAARIIHNLRKDQDVTFELGEAWRRMQRLHGQFDERANGRAGADGDRTVRLLQDQLQIAAALDVTRVIARAYAALARTEPVTVGGRAIPAAGLKRARELADLAMAFSPDGPEAHYLMGDVLVESEQLQAADAEYRRALGADAPSSAGRTKLAAALRLQGRMSDALVELEEAQRIDPTYARAHNDAGMILRAGQQLPAAISAYREAVRLAPDFIDAHNGLAMTLANSGKPEEAVAEFREIIRIDPDSTIGYFNLAHVLADLDRDVESAAALREVIHIYPDHYNARYNLAELFRLEGKYDDSATQFREYLRLAPDAPQNRRNITRATGLIQQFEDPNAPLVPDTMKPNGPR